MENEVQDVLIEQIRQTLLDIEAGKTKLIAVDWSPQITGTAITMLVLNNPDQPLSIPAHDIQALGAFIFSESARHGENHPVKKLSTRLHQLLAQQGLLRKYFVSRR